MPLPHPGKQGRISKPPFFSFATTYQRCRSRTEGIVADHIPALADTDPELFGISVADVGGAVHVAGEADAEFSIQSISKAFVDVVFGLLIGLLGCLVPVCADALWECVGGFLRDRRRMELFGKPMQLSSSPCGAIAVTDTRFGHAEM